MVQSLRWRRTATRASLRVSELIPVMLCSQSFWIPQARGRLSLNSPSGCGWYLRQSMGFPVSLNLPRSVGESCRNRWNILAVCASVRFMHNSGLCELCRGNSGLQIPGWARRRVSAAGCIAPHHRLRGLPTLYCRNKLHPIVLFRIIVLFTWMSSGSL